jgi:glycine/D-amino acid oxidase-like deaminating enzyme
MHVVVIGAGIVGTSVAFELAKAGAKVSVLEASSVAGGASSVSFAWTNATGKRPRSYFSLNVAGMRAHLDLAREFGHAPWFNQTGSLEWWTTAQSRDDQQENFRCMKDWGYGAEWIDAKQAKLLEHDLDVEAIGDAPILYYPEEGWVDPVVYVAWLLRVAASRWSVTLRSGTQVTGLRTTGGKVSGVRLDSGEDVLADAVVNCTGSWAAERIDDAPQLPMNSSVGVLAFTRPVATTLRRQFHAEDLDVRPDGAGRIMIHKVSVDQAVDAPLPLDPQGPEGATLLEAASQYLPILATTGIEAVRTTMRPVPGDGLTVAGPVPQLPGYFMIVTHSGVTLAPYLGKAIAQEIVRGVEHADLTEFRPSRLLARDSAPAIARAVPAKKRGNEFA